MHIKPPGLSLPAPLDEPFSRSKYCTDSLPNRRTVSQLRWKCQNEDDACPILSAYSIAPAQSDDVALKPLANIEKRTCLVDDFAWIHLKDINNSSNLPFHHWVYELLAIFKSPVALRSCDMRQALRDILPVVAEHVGDPDPMVHAVACEFVLQAADHPAFGSRMNVLMPYVYLPAQLAPLLPDVAARSVFRKQEKTVGRYLSSNADSSPSRSEMSITDSEVSRGARRLHLLARALRRYGFSGAKAKVPKISPVKKKSSSAHGLQNHHGHSLPRTPLGNTLGTSLVQSLGSLTSRSGSSSKMNSPTSDPTKLIDPETGISFDETVKLACSHLDSKSPALQRASFFSPFGVYESRQKTDTSLSA
eukprot:Rmarinus@m.15349